MLHTSEKWNNIFGLHTHSLQVDSYRRWDPWERPSPLDIYPSMFEHSTQVQHTSDYLSTAFSAQSGLNLNDAFSRKYRTYRSGWPRRRTVRGAALNANERGLCRVATSDRATTANNNNPFIQPSSCWARSCWNVARWHLGTPHTLRSAKSGGAQYDRWTRQEAEVEFVP